MTFCVPPGFSGNIPARVIFISANIPTASYFTGTDLIFSAINLPNGLSINPHTGIISGITFSRSSDVVVIATNSCGSAQSNIFTLL